jgi:hypothetical protein
MIELADTPGAPPAGKMSIYPKADHKFYKLAPDGTETELGTGGAGSVSFSYNLTPAGAVDGSNKVFTFSAFVPGSMQLFRDGQLMKPGGADYTETNPAAGTITFVSAPVTGSVLLGSFQMAVSVVGNADTLDGFHASSFAQVSGVRVLLTANRTYYVRTDGSDSNNGLSNTAGGAFKTIQKAMDVAASIDNSIYDVTIQVADGTYVTGVITLKNLLGAGGLFITGNPATPANVVIDGCFHKGTAGTVPVLNGFKLINTTISTAYGVYAYQSAAINFLNFNFGSTFYYHVYADFGGEITVTGNYTVSGNATVHIAAQGRGGISIIGRTVTIVGTPNFAAYYAGAGFGGTILHHGTTISGSATGGKYSVGFNGQLYVGGAGINYFPGNVAGSTNNGGQYG